MPGFIDAISEWQTIADIRRELRRLRSTATAQTSIGEYNEYTLASSSDSAHTLTYIPSLSLIPIACLNGLPGRYGTDYTVDFTTGIVTWSATKVAGDILSVFYQTTGDLVALSGVVDVGGISDTFNRANSTTTINPASDGGSWYVPTGMVAGVLGNAGYLPTVDNTTTKPVCRDLGQASVDFSWTVARNAILNGTTEFTFGADQSFSSMGYWIASNGKASGVGNSQPTLHNLTTLTSWNLVGGTDWTSGAFTTFRVLYHSSTGAITVWQDGVSLLSITDPTPQTGTWVGIYDAAPYSQTGLVFDSFTATPV